MSPEEEQKQSYMISWIIPALRTGDLTRECADGGRVVVVGCLPVVLGEVRVGLSGHHGQRVHLVPPFVEGSRSENLHDPSLEGAAAVTPLHQVLAQVSVRLCVCMGKENVHVQI